MENSIQTKFILMQKILKSMQNLFIIHICLEFLKITDIQRFQNQHTQKAQLLLKMWDRSNTDPVSTNQQNKSTRERGITLK